MDENVKRKMERVDALTAKDILYGKMLEKCKALEREFDRIVSELSMEQRDAVWDFVMLCEDMSVRKLEVACEHMDFTPRIIPFQPKER